MSFIKKKNTCYSMVAQLTFRNIFKNLFKIK